MERETPQKASVDIIANIEKDLRYISGIIKQRAGKC